MLTGRLSESVALGVVLGAIASANVPAAAVDVLWEYKTREILMRTILAIVALDDGLAPVLYGSAGGFAGVLDRRTPRATTRCRSVVIAATS